MKRIKPLVVCSKRKEIVAVTSSFALNVLSRDPLFSHLPSLRWRKHREMQQIMQSYVRVPYDSTVELIRVHAFLLLLP